MSSSMPKDSNGVSIPCITLRADGGAHKITTSTSSPARNTTPFKDDTVVISIWATEDVYIKFLDSPNDAPASADDHFYPASIYYNFDLGGRIGEAYADPTPGKKYISVLAVSKAGTVYISECG